jgi:hypothetical protein
MRTGPEHPPEMSDHDDGHQRPDGEEESHVSTQPAGDEEVADHGSGDYPERREDERQPERTTSSSVLIPSRIHRHPFGHRENGANDAQSCWIAAGAVAPTAGRAATPEPIASSWLMNLACNEAVRPDLSPQRHRDHREEWKSKL